MTIIASYFLGIVSGWVLRALLLPHPVPWANKPSQACTCHLMHRVEDGLTHRVGMEE